MVKRDEAAIFVNNVTKVYRIPSIFPWRKTQLTEALREVSFTCPKRKITCLLGPNGAGKTTIIKILAGLVLPDAGDAVTLGVSLYESTQNLRHRIGIATPNERSFYWRLTGRQNLDFYASMYGINGKERKNRITEALSLVDLIQDADKPYRLYSTGMKQKLLLSRAIINKPDILLLDEPTSHLDPLVRRKVYGLIKRQFIETWKTTILLCTNDLSEAQELADHLIFLNNGRIRAEGTLSSLWTKLNPHIRLVLEFTSMPNEGWDKDLRVTQLLKENNRIELNICEKNEIPDIICHVVSSGGKLISCRLQEESISEVYTRLSAGELR
jgi:ABC-2 type transport system ATP-binding protein